MTPRQLVLTGLPGSGKSTVGRVLAGRIGWTFIDLDEAIEERAGRAIAEIFAASGEEGFRDLEAESTRAHRDADRLILAPGAGWVTRPATVALIRPPAVMAYLRVSLEVASYRLARSPVARPLLGRGQRLERLEALWREREPLYRTADLTVDAELIVEEVVRELEAWLVPEPWHP